MLWDESASIQLAAERAAQWQRRRPRPGASNGLSRGAGETAKQWLPQPAAAESRLGRCAGRRSASVSPGSALSQLPLSRAHSLSATKARRASGARLTRRRTNDDAGRRRRRRTPVLIGCAAAAAYRARAEARTPRLGARRPAASASAPAPAEPPNRRAQTPAGAYNDPHKHTSARAPLNGLGAPCRASLRGAPRVRVLAGFRSGDNSL